MSYCRKRSKSGGLRWSVSVFRWSRRQSLRRRAFLLVGTLSGESLLEWKVSYESDLDEKHHGEVFGA
jgi:hypothetical protein